MYNHRMKCPATNKFVYDTKQQAQEKLYELKDKSFKAKQGRRLRVYRCPYCDWYHLGHSSRGKFL